MEILVLKFGGTSVKYGITHIIDIINELKLKWEKIIIFVSALSQVTNLLLDGLENFKNLKKNINQINKNHQEILTENSEDIKNYLLKYEFDCNHSKELKNNPKLLRDKISSYGELMSINTVSKIFINNNILHKTITSDEFIITDSNYGDPCINMDMTRKLVKSKLLNLFEKTNIILTTGYISKSENGNLTTLGRGGSDLSATLIGSLINASEIRIYSDVDGLLTADPKKVNSAKLIEEIDIKEAAELSFFGAKVIHPKTIQPLIKNNIPLKILNTFNHNQPGTIIQKYEKIYNSNNLIKGVTSISNMELITIEGTGILGKVGILSKIFKTISDLDISIPFITQASSETSVCFAIQKKFSVLVSKALKKSLQKEIENEYIQRINTNNNISLITIIGNNMKQKPGIAGKIFNQLGKDNINVISISQGSTEISITIVISSKDEITCLNSIHNNFL